MKKFLDHVDNKLINGITTIMDNSIGQTIWQQITLATKMACGARDAVLLANGVQFTVLRSKATKIQVMLNANDTYTVNFMRIRKYNFDLVERADEVYVDNLNEVIYRMCNK